MDKSSQESHEDSAVTLPLMSMHLRTPRGEIAETILQPKRAPAVETTGVLPRIAHVLPE